MVWGRKGELGERDRERVCLFTCRLSIVDSTVNMYGLIY